MKLSISVFAVALCFSIPAVADVQSKSETECYRNARGVYQCRSQIETADSIRTTYCAIGRRTTKCEHDAPESKGPPPAPAVEQSSSGVLIMRGSPR